LVRDPWPGSNSRNAFIRWSLASLGPPATVRVASGDGVIRIGESIKTPLERARERLSIAR
jgi:hypothetical protein